MAPPPPPPADDFMPVRHSSTQSSDDRGDVLSDPSDPLYARFKSTPYPPPPPVSVSPAVHVLRSFFVLMWSFISMESGHCQSNRIL